MIKDIVTKTAPSQLVDHSACPAPSSPGILYEKHPTAAEGLFNVWVTIDNPRQFNSYSIDMLKALQQAFRTAGEARDVVAVVLTGAGSKAFCTGGDAMEFATYYAGNPQEFRRFMRLFDDTISAILACDKPVICRVNGLRSGGGQELGLACDLSVAQDLAVFGQAGPKHGGAMVGGATDFLPVMIGAEEAMAAGILCDPISAHKARRLGMISAVVPALKVDSRFIPNPSVVTDRVVDEFGEFILGEPKAGGEIKAAKEIVAKGEIDLSRLDAKVEELCSKFLHMSPEALTKTLEELRKPKLDAWNRSKEGNRAWAAINMTTEAHAGFKAFAVGNKEVGREVNFVALRQAQAIGAPWTPDLIEALMPGRIS
ncbi:6-oxocyclohex-1-ene-1-carbonyl-CoA hydrolase [Paramagnetospirillum caucaseum]|uniref:6-oxocyclohex-1-ene-1-carbonyl-CoA hydratase n=1 Tax=Paramagnetospirillum caucaseum TaxID=1244869 RepID=M3AAX4_9PROT|nr:6-oxocyclohex-1-ene-1-carbonyl-CoA hydratase [Paramagnetospirillum caucaseum]EME69958.1 6-oxocyclohex-1-ene-1-carbonyl-CoA hydrolase [Paramagnetospirillum caucaseum]